MAGHRNEDQTVRPSVPLCKQSVNIADVIFIVVVVVIIIISAISSVTKFFYASWNASAD